MNVHNTSLVLLLLAPACGGGKDSDTSIPNDTDTGSGTGIGVSEIDVPVESFYPEGVAIDAATDTLYVGSAAIGSLWKASLADGVVTELVASFATGGVFTGMKVQDGTLWACSNPSDVSTTASSLVKINPSDGAIEESYDLAVGTFCNDLIFTEDGTAYVTDSFGGLIFRLAPGASALERWFDDPAFAPAPGTYGFIYESAATVNDKVGGGSAAADVVR